MRVVKITDNYGFTYKVPIHLQKTFNSNWTIKDNKKEINAWGETVTQWRMNNPEKVEYEKDE